MLCIIVNVLGVLLYLIFERDSAVVKEKEERTKGALGENARNNNGDSECNSK